MIDKIHNTDVLGRPTAGLSEEEFNKRLEIMAEIAISNPGMPPEEVKRQAGLEGLETPSSGDSTDLRIPGEMAGGVKIKIHRTLDFFGGRATTESGILRNPEIRRTEREELEKRSSSSLNLFNKVEREYELFCRNPQSFNPDTIKRNLSYIQAFKASQAGITELVDHLKRILFFETFFSKHLDFYKLRDIFESYKKLDYSREKEIKKLILNCEDGLCAAFNSDFFIIKDFFTYVRRAQNLDFEMDRELKKMQNFFNRENKNILNIPEANLKSFAEVLVKFHDIYSKRFSFEHKIPIRPSTVNSLKIYWELFREVLFGDFDREIEVSFENLESLKKRFSRMKLFAGIYPYSEDEEIKESIKIFEKFLSDFTLKIDSSLKLCEKIILENKQIPKTPKTEMLLQAALKIVFSCQVLKENLRKKLMQNKSIDSKIFETQDIREVFGYFYAFLGWNV